MSDQTNATGDAKHWSTLAKESESMAFYERSIGLDHSLPGCSPGDHRARIYRSLAAACQLEVETGRRHCSECLGEHLTQDHGATSLLSR